MGGLSSILGTTIFDKVNEILILKSTLNKFLADTQENYYRVEQPYTEYLAFQNKEKQKLITNIETDVEEAKSVFKSIPIFFTKGPLKSILGELPEFGTFRQIYNMVEGWYVIFYHNIRHYTKMVREMQNAYIERKYLPKFEEFYNIIFGELDKTLKVFRDIKIITNWFAYKGKTEFVSESLAFPFDAFFGCLIILMGLLRYFMIGIGQ
jgi:hypothetical protein